MKSQGFMNRFRMRREVRDEQGGVTVEFVIWLPVFVLVLMMVVDVSMVFLTQSRMWDVARDSARRMSIGLYDEAEAEAFAETNAALTAGVVPDVDATLGATEVTVEITVNGGDVNIFGVFPFDDDQEITARVIQLREPS